MAAITTRQKNKRFDMTMVRGIHTKEVQWPGGSKRDTRIEKMGTRS
jgi:hypothetical protein